MSKEIIESGKAIDKLHTWVQYQGYNDGIGLMRFEKVIANDRLTNLVSANKTIQNS